MQNYYPDQFFKDLILLNHKEINSHHLDPKDHEYKLGVISESNKGKFLCYLSLEIMLNMIFHTYLNKKEYQEYIQRRNILNIPKLDFCGHGKVNSHNPFSILNKDIKDADFMTCIVFFFYTNTLTEKELNTVKKAFREDKDLKDNPFIISYLKYLETGKFGTNKYDLLLKQASEIILVRENTNTRLRLDKYIQETNESIEICRDFMKKNNLTKLTQKQLESLDLKGNLLVIKSKLKI
jgi:hypothetical protein